MECLYDCGLMKWGRFNWFWIWLIGIEMKSLLWWIGGLERFLLLFVVIMMVMIWFWVTGWLILCDRWVMWMWLFKIYLVFEMICKWVMCCCEICFVLCFLIIFWFWCSWLEFSWWIGLYRYCGLIVFFYKCWV